MNNFEKLDKVIEMLESVPVKDFEKFGSSLEPLYIYKGFEIYKNTIRYEEIDLDKNAVFIFRINELYNKIDEYHKGLLNESYNKKLNNVFKKIFKKFNF